MSEYIRPALAAVTAVITKYSPDLLAAIERPPFAEYGRVFTGQLKNPPSLWVMPARTQLGEEGTFLKQQSIVTLKLGLVAGEPELLVDLVLDYVRAVTDAIFMADPGDDWGPSILRVFPQVHDYGPLYEKGHTFARFPEVHLVIDHAEVEPQ